MSTPYEQAVVLIAIQRDLSKKPDAFMALVVIEEELDALWPQLSVAEQQSIEAMIEPYRSKSMEQDDIDRIGRELTESEFAWAQALAMLRTSLVAYVGERCPDHCDECFNCQKWRAFDALVGDDFKEEP